MLINRRQIPSMLLLREDINNRFRILANRGITTMQELNTILKSKKKAEAFADEVGIDKNYMVVLRRSVASFVPPQRNLAKYSTINKELISSLLANNIKTSKELYEYLVTKSHQEAAEQLNINPEQVNNLFSLMDITRIRYVTPVIATLLVQAGYDSVKKIAKAEQQKLYDDFHNTNNTLQLYGGQLSLNDALFLINDAKLFMSQ